MALTPAFCTGFEHGVSIAAANGGGLGGANSGAPTVRTNKPRTGAYACRINPAGGASGLNLQMPPGPAMSATKAAQRCYINFTTKPTAASNLVYFPGPTNVPIFQYDSTNDQFRLQISGGSLFQMTDTHGFTTGVWYLVELWADVSTTAYVLKGRVSGGGLTPTIYAATFTAAAAGTITRCGIGTATTHTYDMEVDDWIGGPSTASDFESFGAGHVLLLKPTSDGTHNAGTNVIEDNAGTDIGATTAFDKIDDIPMSETTSYVRQNATGSGNYAEVAFENIDASHTVNAVEAILAYSSATTTANAAETRIRRGDGTPTDVLGVGATGTGNTSTQKTNVGTAWDMSDTGPLYKAALVPHTANGTDVTGWTVAEVNALLARVGFATDASPIPQWLNLVLEVDVSPENVAVGQATETDTVTVMGIQHRKAMGQSTESDSTTVMTPQTGGGGQHINVNQVTETDSATAMGRQHQRAVGQAAEADTVTAMAVRHLKAIVQALETDSTTAFTHAKQRTVLQALETDVSQPWTGQRLHVLAQALESDLAQALTHARQVRLGQSLEADSATQWTAQRRHGFNQATESDLAQPFTYMLVHLVGQALETDSANAMAVLHRRSIGQALEADTVFGVTAIKGRVIGQPSEVDSTFAFTHRKEGHIGQALESDSGTQVRPTSLVPIGLPLEVDVAQPMTRRLLFAVRQAEEFDTAQVVGHHAFVVVGQAEETDSALRVLFGINPPFDVVLVATEGGSVAIVVPVGAADRAIRPLAAVVSDVQPVGGAQAT